MFEGRPRIGVAGIAATLLVLFASQASACQVSSGDRIMLASQALDPDVFVWDSAQRLINYIEGDYNVETVLRHTLLVRPGTKAVAVACRESAARPKYGKVMLDIVGVKLTSGPGHGRYGWVASEDVRLMGGKPLTRNTP